MFIHVHLKNSPLSDQPASVLCCCFSNEGKYVPSSHLNLVVQDSVVIQTVNENLRLSSSPNVLSICERMYRRKLSGRRLRSICDRHYLLLEYFASLENWSTLTQPALQNWIYSVSKYQRKLFATTYKVNRRTWTEPEHWVQGLCKWTLTRAIVV